MIKSQRTEILQKIISILRKHPYGVSAQEIIKQGKIKKPTFYKYIRELMEIGIVSYSNGKYVIFTVCPPQYIHYDILRRAWVNFVNLLMNMSKSEKPDTSSISSLEKYILSDDSIYKSMRIHYQYEDLYTSLAEALHKYTNGKSTIQELKATLSTHLLTIVTSNIYSYKPSNECPLCMLLGITNQDLKENWNTWIPFKPLKSFNFE